MKWFDWRDAASEQRNNSMRGHWPIRTSALFKRAAMSASRHLDPGWAINRRFTWMDFGNHDRGSSLAFSMAVEVRAADVGWSARTKKYRLKFGGARTYLTPSNLKTQPTTAKLYLRAQRIAQCPFSTRFSRTTVIPL